MSRNMETDRSRAIQDRIRRVYPFVWSLRLYGVSLPELAFTVRSVITWAYLYLGAAVLRPVGSRVAVSRRMLAVIAVADVVLGLGLVGATRTTLNGLANIVPLSAPGPAVAPATPPSRMDSPATGRGVRFALHHMEARRCRLPATS